MITKARFKNFKLLRDVELPLTKLNVIVGANGAGKSSVLEALYYLLQLGSLRSRDESMIGGRAAAFFSGPRSPAQLLSRPDAKLMSLSASGDRFEKYELVCKSSPDTGSYAFTLSFRGIGPAPGDMTCTFTEPSQTRETFFREVDAANVSSVVRVRLDATQLAKDHYSEEKAPSIEYDGEGLASVLQELQVARDGRFEEIERDLARIVPGVRRLRSTRARIVRNERVRISIDGHETLSEQKREYTGSGFEIEWGKVGWIPAQHVSEGTLLALGLLTILHHKPPLLVMLDDIDKALHPLAQQELVSLLTDITNKRPDVQVLATTHSPFVVDALQPENVLVAACVDEKSARVRPLSDHPTWGKRREYLQPGEFWSAVGESWVAENKE